MVAILSPVLEAGPLSQTPFLLRRPVLGRRQQLLGYDILHCGADQTDDVEMALATRVDALAAGQLVFVAVTRELLLMLDKLPSVADGRSLVMVVATDIDVDDVLLAAVNRLVAAGYMLALADFDYGKNHNALLPYADFIRLSVNNCSDDVLQPLLASLQEFPVKLIAEDVDSYAQFERARGLGFDGFCGEFYRQRLAVERRELPVATISLLRLAVLVQEERLDVSAMEQLISRDVVLSYQLLHYINSAAFALRSKVESIRHAIVLLGPAEVRKWSLLVSILCVKDKPDELMRASLWRASMCELLCDDSGQGNPGTAFIVGLFSLLDAMFDQPMAALLGQLPLADDISAALLRGKGDYAELLACVRAYEAGDSAAVSFSSLTPGQIEAVYLRAIARADQAMKGLAATEEDVDFRT